MDSVPPPAPSGVTTPAAGRGFAALLGLRVLTVLNDNLLRWLAIGLGKRAVAAGDQSLVLTIGTAGFVLPFVLLAWLSGWLADRFPKRSVIVGCKLAEVLIAVVAAVVVARGVGPAATDTGAAAWPVGLWWLLAALVAIGCQAALLAPAVLGTIPETVPERKLSDANGSFAMLTLVATLAGTAGGNWLADVTPVSGGGAAAIPAAAALVGVALAGWLAALPLARRPAADPAAPPPFNAIGRSVGDLRELATSPDLLAAAAGSAFFWGLGVIANLNVDQLVAEGGARSQSQVVPFLVVLGLGIGVGSLLAGKLSARGVNLGLVPMGSVVMTVASLALWLGPGPLFVDGAASPLAWWQALVGLGALGLGAGLFDVPLEAHFQQRSPPARRGALLSALNLLVFAAMFLASMLYGALRAPVGESATPLVSARGVFAGFAAAGVVATIVAACCAPRATVRAFVSGVVGAGWRFRVRDAERVPAEGPLLVVCNHVSWLDGFLLVLAAPRPLRMVVYGPNIRGRFLRRLADQWRFILFEPGPKSIARALGAIREGLAGGDAVGIFSEGGISRTGQLLGFKRGLEWLLGRARAPIVPAVIDGMWGSRLSFSEGRFFRKWPRRAGGWRRPVTVRFGDPLPVGTSPSLSRLAVQEVAASAARDRLVATRDPDRDISRWMRRFGGAAAGPTRAALEAVAAGRAIDACGTPRTDSGPIPSPAGPARPVCVAAGDAWLDWAALAATAEAFDGCCLLRREDRMFSSLAPGDPLHVRLGLLGGPLLGIRADAAPADTPLEGILRRIVEGRATVWLGRVEQVLAASAQPLAASLEAVVIPVCDVAELDAARVAARSFAAAHGIEPVVAFAPDCLTGLVAMNTPPGRAVSHETTCRSDSLGRVVTGAVVWPQPAIRRALGRPALASSTTCDPVDDPLDGRPLVVTAAGGRRAADPARAVDPAWGGLRFPAWVDDDGFLVPGEPVSPPASAAE